MEAVLTEWLLTLLIGDISAHHPAYILTAINAIGFMAASCIMASFAMMSFVCPYPRTMMEKVKSALILALFFAGVIPLFAIMVATEDYPVLATLILPMFAPLLLWLGVTPTGWKLWLGLVKRLIREDTPV